MACKVDLLKSLEAPYGAFRANRERFAGTEGEGEVSRILEEGSRRARERAEKTMQRVREAMHLR